MSRMVDVAALRDTLDLDPNVVSDDELQVIADAVDAALLPRLKGGLDHEPHPNCQEAALGMAVQVWQSRSAPGGQMLGADMGVYTSPHLLGPGLVARFGGLLMPCLHHGGVGIA